MTKAPFKSKCIFIAASVAFSATMNGCGGKDAILPQDGPTMLDVYEHHTGGQGAGSSGTERSALRRPLADSEIEVGLQFESDSQSPGYRRLKNPDLVMYVFPHRGVGDAPIPGYTTVFPMYVTVTYALPGEPTE